MGYYSAGLRRSGEMGLDAERATTMSALSEAIINARPCQEQRSPLRITQSVESWFRRGRGYSTISTAWF